MTRCVCGGVLARYVPDCQPIRAVWERVGRQPASNPFWAPRSTPAKSVAGSKSAPSTTVRGIDAMTHGLRLMVGQMALILGFFGWIGASEVHGQVTPPASSVEASTSPTLTPVAPIPDLESAPVSADEAKALRVAINMAWILVSAFLALSLKAGFTLFETGLIRSKNVAHTAAMNLGIFAIGVIGFWACGFGLMFGGHGAFGSLGGSGSLDSMGSLDLFGRRWDVMGLDGFFLAGSAGQASILAAFLFQTVFMDTATTIPTGAMAERWKYSAFFAFGLVASMLIYPIYGCWTWGGGWLADLGTSFGLGSGHVDFAGSSVVHMTGGLMALAGSLALGPRIGKFNQKGGVNAIPGHNIPMAAVGTLILVFGWSGLNAGRVLDATDLRIGSIATCTILATGAGCLTSLLTMWLAFGKPDPTMGCNGLLAGAVAISASCAFVDPTGAVIIGAISGILVVGSILFVEKVMRVDDPVGAISVHGTCGAFGCLAVGLFATGDYGRGYNGVVEPPIGLFHGGGGSQLLAQAIGVTANAAWVFPMSLLAFAAIGRTIGNRVSARAEVEGLDVPEMGVLGYVSEDTYAVQTAGQDYLATFGPGVPPKGSSKPARNPGKAGRKP
ncbi:ammonium transporter [Tundrisphaera lichenicola]|uniref:ammonium transporter n=1 Tax=Tundrisphaera lichenicola TaxID=2029860 RepID=UPI003EBDBBC4